jgi:hypothetical protein
MIIGLHIDYARREQEVRSFCPTDALRLTELELYDLLTARLELIPFIFFYHVFVLGAQALMRVP